MPTIDATVGGASANSFVTELEQIAYMEARLNRTGWTTISGSTLTDDEKRALIEATRDVSAMYFIGERATATQALGWPRQNAIDPDDPNLTRFATTALPQRVKDATSELAFQYLKAGTTDVAARPSSDGVKREKVDVIETEYFEHSQASGMDRYPRVLAWLQPLLAASPAGITVPLIRG